MVRKILGLAKKQIMRGKIKESRVGVNSSLLRIFMAETLAAPAVRFQLKVKGRKSYFHPPGEIRTTNGLDLGKKVSRTFYSD